MTYPFGDAEQFFSFDKIEDPALRAYLYDEAGALHARHAARWGGRDPSGTQVDELLRKLLLNEAVRRAGDPLRRATYPMGIFISYKWAGGERQAQVASIAGTLQRLGWQVHFDEGLPRTATEVTTHVAKLAASRYVLSIWTDDYAAETVGPQPSKAEWLFDEFNYSMASYNHCGEPEIIALWLEGETAPHGHFLVDVRGFSEEQRSAALAQRITYDGPRLDESEAKNLCAVLAECAVGYRAREYARVLPLLDRILFAYPFVQAAHRLKIMALYDAERLQDAIAAARTARGAVHPLDGRYTLTSLLASMLAEADQRQEALALQCELLNTGPPRWLNHFGAAVSLVALGEPWAARAHFLRAADLPAEQRQPAWVVFSNLPQIYRRLGRDDVAMVLDLAIRKHMGKSRLDDTAPRPAATEILESLDAMDAADDRLPSIRCDTCRAALPADPPAACGRCGASRSPDGGQRCRCCGHGGRVPLAAIATGIAVRCPICKQGFLHGVAAAPDDVPLDDAVPVKRPWWRRLF